jgi:hypothetical protein
LGAVIVGRGAKTEVGLVVGESLVQFLIGRGSPVNA